MEKPSRKVLDRQTHQVGVLFLATGLVATLAFWRLHVFSVEVLEVPLGGGAITCALMGLACLVAPSYGAWHRARCLARGVDPDKGFLDRLSFLVTPRKRKAPRTLSRGEALKQVGGIALLVCTFVFVVDEVVSRVVSWKETTCRVQILGPGRVRATYTDGFRTLSFTDDGIGEPSDSVPCYVAPGRKSGAGTFQRPTGSRLPRSTAFSVLLAVVFVSGLALLGLGHARAKRLI